MKECLVDEPPKYIKGIEFGVLSSQEIIKQAEVEIATRDLYDLEKGRQPKENGAIDQRMVCKILFG
jgi:DNA-directed RNA polymerase III subunit RPC1